MSGNINDLVFSFKVHIGNKRPVKRHFGLCNITLNEEVVSFLGRKYQTQHVLTLETLSIKEISPVLNRKYIGVQGKDFYFEILRFNLI